MRLPLIKRRGVPVGVVHRGYSDGLKFARGDRIINVGKLYDLSEQLAQRPVIKKRERLLPVLSCSEKGPGNFGGVSGDTEDVSSINILTGEGSPK